MLLQGRTPPPPPSHFASQQPLPLLQELPPGPPLAPSECHVFNEPEDTTGQARVRGIPSIGIPPTSNPLGNRTTDWRHRKKAAATTWGSKSVSSTPAAAYGSAPSQLLPLLLKVPLLERYTHAGSVVSP